MEIDTRYGSDRCQFATQVNNIPKWCQEIIDAGFIGNETPDFYEGLLAGYATSLAIIQQMAIEPQKALISSIVAYIANHTINK